MQCFLSNKKPLSFKSIQTILIKYSAIFLYFYIFIDKFCVDGGWSPTRCISQVTTESYTEQEESDNNITTEKVSIKIENDYSWKLKNGRCWTWRSSLDHKSKEKNGKTKNAWVCSSWCQVSIIENKLSCKICLKEIFLRLKGLI